jgi:hypothetical protein
MDIMDKFPQKNKNTAWRVIDRETVLIDLERHDPDTKLNILNDSATAIWELCDGKHTVKSILLKLKNLYNGEPLEIEAQALQCIDELINKKMLLF